MRFSTTFAVLLASISQAMGMLAFGKPSYSNGVLTVTTTAWSDAPAAFNLALVSADGTVTTIGQNLSPTPGQWAIALPSGLPSGTYRLQAQSADGSSVYTTTSGFSVDQSSFPASQTLLTASVNVVSTGTVRPFVTGSVVSDSSTTYTTSYTVVGAAAASSISAAETSGLTTIETTFTTTSTPSPVPTTSLFSTDSVFTSGSITTTIPITSLVTTEATQSATEIAQAATTTSRSAGFKTAMGAGSSLVAAFVLGALLL